MLVLNDIFLALLLAAVVSSVFAVPSLFLAAYRSSKTLKRYQVIGSIEKMGLLSTELAEEWSTVKSSMAYSAVITEEIERLNTLKPMLFQTMVSAVLLLLVAVLSEIEDVARYVVLGLFLLCLVSIIFGMVNYRKYTEEYEEILAELDMNGSESCGSMYA